MDDTPQEFNDLSWGTPMPIMLRLGSEIVSLRARGIWSIVVSNPQLFKERAGDTDALPGQVRSILASILYDALGEMSGDKSDIAKIAACSSEIATAIKPKVEQELNAWGLTVKQISIDAIERI
jgi:membrane protease subunit (stomatin/prohibitin family)